MAGRPRKPIGQKIVEGTYRPDRDGPPDAVVQAAGVPVPPDDLQGDALAFWQRIVPGLVEMKVVGACDAPSLALMCWWHAQLAATCRDVDGYREKVGKEGPCPPLGPLYVQAGIATDKFNQLAARFGLTPSDRAKLRVEPASGPAAMPVPPRKR